MKCAAILFSMRTGVCCYNGRSVHIQSNNTVNNCLSITFQLNVICFEALRLLRIYISSVFLPFRHSFAVLVAVFCALLFFYLSFRWLSKGWQNTTPMKHENINVILPTYRWVFGCFRLFQLFVDCWSVQIHFKVRFYFFSTLSHRLCSYFFVLRIWFYLCLSLFKYMRLENCQLNIIPYYSVIQVNK